MSLDDELRRRGILLLAKTCKACGIIPSSYLLQEESIHVGRVFYHGGFADVRDGEYLGCPVAIKYLRIKEEDSDRALKVLRGVSSASAFVNFPSGCVEKL